MLLALVCVLLAGVKAGDPDTIGDLKPKLEEIGARRAPAFGLLRLEDPNPKRFPPACANFENECALEREGQLGRAIASYEDRFMNCSLVGWQKVGTLGSGMRVTMKLWRTPCGTEVAVKSTHVRELVAEHVNVDCNILKILHRYRSEPLCNNCFPEFYYSSPDFTGACYSERIVGVTTNFFLDAIDAKTPMGLGKVKHLFKQGLGILTVLTEANVRHRDMILTNTMVRLPTAENPHWQLVFVDFGGSWAPGVENVATGREVNRFASSGRPDSYMLACLFYRYFYPGGNVHVCRRDEMVARLNDPALSPNSLAAYLLYMMNMTHSVGHEPFHFTRAIHDDMAMRLQNVTGL